MKNKGKHSLNNNKKNNVKNHRNPRIQKTNVQSKRRNNNIKKIILTLLIIFFLVMMIISGYQLIKWYLNNKANQDIIKEIEENNLVVHDEVSDEVSVDFSKLKEINSDIVGYVEVPNTNIAYPVVQTTNNEYYLRYNLKKEYNNAGWIFMDYRNKIDGTDKNTIIYGHNMRDGSMFGSLKNILTPDWYNNEENKYVSLTTELGNMKYEVFSVYQIEKEDYYIQTSFNDNTEYESFINTITARSVKNFNVLVTVDDSILTLSTCANNNKYRVVLHAKLVK